MFIWHLKVEIIHFLYDKEYAAPKQLETGLLTTIYHTSRTQTVINETTNK